MLVVNMFFHGGNHMYKIANDKSFVRLNGKFWMSKLFGGIANDISHGLAHIHHYLFEINIVLKKCPHNKYVVTCDP